TPQDAQVTNHPSQFNYGGVVIPPPPPPLPQFNYGGVAIPPPLSPPPPPPLYGMPIRFGLSIPHLGHPVPSIASGSFGVLSPLF
ncbi:hypothetical protein A2U01_0032504, partial [Trifolium medium]|nr:hypothetical protein [Trifolium medium]